MIVNASTMLFEELDASLCGEMKDWCKSVILKGVVPSPDPYWVREWFEKCGLDNSQSLLTRTLLLPQRALFSLVLNAS